MLVSSVFFDLMTCVQTSTTTASCLQGLLFTNKTNGLDCFDYSAGERAKLTIIRDDNIVML